MSEDVLRVALLQDDADRSQRGQGSAAIFETCALWLFLRSFPTRRKSTRSRVNIEAALSCVLNLKQVLAEIRRIDRLLLDLPAKAAAQSPLRSTLNTSCDASCVVIQPHRLRGGAAVETTTKDSQRYWFNHNADNTDTVRLYG